MISNPRTGNIDRVDGLAFNIFDILRLLRMNTRVQIRNWKNNKDAFLKAKKKNKFIFYKCLHTCFVNKYGVCFKIVDAIGYDVIREIRLPIKDNSLISILFCYQFL